MVRKNKNINKNKNKIGGKVSSMMMMSPSFNDSISKPSMVKNIMKTQTLKPKSEGKMNFYNKYCNNKVQQNLVDAMNILINRMANSKDKNEQLFVKSLNKNSEMIPFLTLNKNTNTLSMTMNGGADGDENKCANSNVVSVVRNTPPVTTTGIQAIQEQITQVNEQLTLARSENNQEMVNSLINQLQNLSMIETMARQRQQAIDIVNRRENWNMAGNVCNRVTQLVFTGLSGYLSYLVLNLVKNAGSLITGAAGGILSLFVIIVIDTISKIVNGVSSNVPSWLGGGNLMGSGREIVEDITNRMNEGINETPELNAIVIQLNELGYTSNIIAFIILFILFNIIAHIARIFMTSNQFSLGFTGISVGQIQTQQPLSDLQVNSTLPITQATPPTIENVQQSSALEDEGEEVSGGYKSKKRRSRGKKRKSRKQAKKHKTRKGKKAKRKMRKTRKR